MHTFESGLSKFLQEIGIATSITEVFTALKNVSLLLGFDSTTYTYIPLVLGKKLNQFSPVYLISQSYEKNSLAHCTSKYLKQNNFAIKKLRSGDIEHMIWQIEEKKTRITDCNQRVCSIDERKSNIVRGVTIPTHYSQTGVAGVSLTCSGKTAKLPLVCKERLKLISAIAQVFSDRLLVLPTVQHHFMKPFLQLLTKTEKVILKHLAQGHAPKTIAYKLNSSQKYVNNAIYKLREKLGGITRDQLLYFAGLVAFDKLVDEF